MTISARNVFSGTISDIKVSAVNAEVIIDVSGGDKIVSTVTIDSVKALGLEVGSNVTAYIKAPSVMVLAGSDSMKYSARNHLSGVVSELKSGAVNSEVVVTLVGGSSVKAIITNEAVAELSLTLGSQASVLFKAGSVILGVSA